MWEFLGELELSENKKIVVQKVDYASGSKIDIRMHVDTPTYTGPTKLAVRLPIPLWNAFKELINQIEVNDNETSE